MKTSFTKVGSKNTCDLEWHLGDYVIKDSGFCYSVDYRDQFVAYTDKLSTAKNYVKEQIRTNNVDAKKRILAHGGV